jgi:ADP-ribosylglycohydrolase
MIAGADADDTQLAALIRSSLLAQQERDRPNWLKQIELGLDGYGDRHRDTAARIRNILRMLALERGSADTAPPPVRAALHP